MTPKLAFHHEVTGRMSAIDPDAPNPGAEGRRGALVCREKFRNTNADGAASEHESAGERFPLFRNRGDGTFRGVSSESGVGKGAALAHGGCGFADFDNDGRLDVVVAALRGETGSWENVSRTGNHWLRLRLIGTNSNRDGIGARVRVGDRHSHMTTAVGYTSSSHGGVHLGLGPARRMERVEIRRPRGVAARSMILLGDPGAVSTRNRFPADGRRRCGGRRPAAQFRHHLHRRPGLRRHRSVRRPRV